MSMIHEITALAPRNKRSQRKGRGESSGRGKTSGRGNKAAHGGDVAWKPGHEGGQTPIHRRMPKRGFSNENWERRFHIVNLAELEKFDAGTTVDAAVLHEKGLIPDLKQPVKILGEGAFSKKLTIVAGWYSKSALEKITSAGGTAQNAKGEAFKFPKPTPDFRKITREAKLAGASAGGAKKKKSTEAPAASEPAADAPKSE